MNFIWYLRSCGRKPDSGTNQCFSTPHVGGLQLEADGNLVTGPPALRRRMGEDMILNEVDGLLLNPDVLWSEMAGFHDPQVSLYRGPFLDDFFLKGANESLRAQPDRRRLPETDGAHRQYDEDEIMIYDKA